jgi:hypothetical protein
MMFRNSLFGLALVLGFSSGFSLTSRQLEKISPAIVSIHTISDLGKPRFVGTGFFIGPSHVVTNHHVIEGMDNGTVKLYDGSSYQIEGIVDINEQWDLCLVKVLLPSSVMVESLPLAKSYPDRGDKVYVFGNPMGLEHSVTEGIVSSVRILQEIRGKIIQITAPISPGSSGSPVLNKKGEVVGIATLYMDGAQNLNFAIPFERIELLKPGQLIRLQDKAVTGSLSKNVEYTSYGNSAYSISIPVDWQVIPERQLPNLSDLEGVTCGFSKNDVTEEPYPYVLVSFQQSERLEKQDIDAIVSATRSDTSLIWRFDEGSNSLFYSKCFPTHCAIGLFKFTMNGYLNFTVFTQSAEDAFLDIAIHILKSVQIDESLEYAYGEPPPNATEATEILEAVGALAAQSVYASFISIGTIADGYVNGTYSKESAAELLKQHSAMVSYCQGYIQKLASSPYIVGGDVSYIAKLDDVYGDLVNYSTAFENYLQTGKAEFATIFDNRRKTTYSKVAELLGLEE